MATLPTDARTDFQANIAEDVAALIGEVGIPALYEQRTSQEGAATPAVTITLAPVKRTGRKLGGASVRVGEQHLTDRYMVTVAADTEGVDAGGGVTGAGAVIALRAGDRFLVNGGAIGSAAATVTLKVSADAELQARSHWNTEVTA